MVETDTRVADSGGSSWTGDPSCECYRGGMSTWIGWGKERYRRSGDLGIGHVGRDSEVEGLGDELEHIVPVSVVHRGSCSTL